MTFSAVIDPATVTPQTFRVTGPGGAVDGKLTVKGATVTFAPSARWALLADYVVTVAKTVAAPGLGELSADYRLHFQTRDGAFGKPKRLTTQTTVNLAVSGDRTGHVAVSWSDSAVPVSSFAVLFDPATGSWSQPAALENDTTNNYLSTSVGLNSAGHAFAVTGSVGNVAAAWNRAAGGVWGNVSTVGVAERRDCGLADDDTAMTVWEAFVGNEYRVFAASLSPSDQWSATTTLQNSAHSLGIVRFGSGFLAVYNREPDGQVFSREFQAKSGWLTAKPVTPIGVSAGYFSFDTLGSEAVFTWNDPKGRMQASLFDGEAWVTKELGPVAGGTSSSAGPTGRLVTWVYKKNAYAARYDSIRGWADPITLGPTTAEDIGPGASVDDAGNALAAWPEGTSISWRRSPKSSGDWLAAQQIKDQDPSYGEVFSKGDAAGEVVVIWFNPLGLWASRFE